MQLELSIFVRGAVLGAMKLGHTQDILLKEYKTIILEEVDSVDVDSLAVADEVAMEPMSEAEAEEAAPAGFTQELKKRFIEGGPGFMGIVLLCLILGLAIAIERIIFLNLSTTNTAKLTASVEDALKSGIKVALLTTVFGLIVAIILQIFYNYIVAKIDGIVNDMEDASITLMDMLVANTK